MCDSMTSPSLISVMGWSSLLWMKYQTSPGRKGSFKLESLVRKSRGSLKCRGVFSCWARVSEIQLDLASFSLHSRNLYLIFMRVWSPVLSFSVHPQVPFFKPHPGGYRHHHGIILCQTHSQRLRSKLLRPPSALRSGCRDEKVCYGVLRASVSH